MLPPVREGETQNGRQSTDGGLRTNAKLADCVLHHNTCEQASIAVSFSTKCVMRDRLSPSPTCNDKHRAKLGLQQRPKKYRKPAAASLGQCVHERMQRAVFILGCGYQATYRGSIERICSLRVHSVFASGKGTTKPDEGTQRKSKDNAENCCDVVWQSVPKATAHLLCLKVPGDAKSFVSFLCAVSRRPHASMSPTR